MKVNPLFKDLIQYSSMVAVILAVTAFMFVYIFNNAGTHPVLYAAFVGMRFFLQGLVNIFIMAMVQKWMPEAPARRKNLIRWTAGYLFAFGFFLCSEPAAIYLSPAGGSGWTFRGMLPSALFQGGMNNTIVIIVHSFVILRFEKTNTDLENSRLRAASLESANLLLRQQIHPHFLFNALSALKSLYKTDVHAGEVYLSHLVNFLRASLTEPQARVSPLSEEIRLCNDFLEMQKIRFENALVCTIDIPEAVLVRGFVPSFALQSLIENAIKHNEVTEASPLVIKVFYRDGRIITENNLQERSYLDAPSGRGLVNLIERYKILSGEEVIILQDNKKFSVSIKVLSNEADHH
jgi:hypothetical protein